jgi:hypothetical protein
VVKNPNSAHGGILCRTGCFEKSAEIRLFSKLARSLQTCVHPAEGPLERNTRGIEMTASSSLSRRLFAVVAALAMSTFIVAGSFAPPAAHAVQARYA